MPRKKPLTKKQVGLKYGFRSGLEAKVSEQLDSLGVDYQYEPFKVPFMQPAKKRTYTPDFVLPNGIYIETKGRFTVADRQKHLMIRESNPHLDIRFVFTNSRNKISKGSKTTYADWCVKHGFQYADKLIPEVWIDEQQES